MAEGYEIKLTDGVVLGGDGYLVLDVGDSGAVGNTDTTVSSLSLLRRGARAYSETVSENLVHLMENFADDAAPAHPLVGQLWYDKVTNTMKVYQPEIGATPAGFYGVGGDGLATGLSVPVTIGLSGEVVGSASFDGTANTTIAATLGNSGVTPGTYGAPVIVIDASGRITSASPPGSAIPADQAAVANALGYVAADASKVVYANGSVAMTGTLTVNANVNATGTGKIMENGTALLPKYAVIMWYGALGDIPAGWAICDGTMGTPDLRGRFVVGSGGEFTHATNAGSVNNVYQPTMLAAGEHNHTLSITGVGTHTHSGTTGNHALTVAELPPHSHKLGSTGVPRVGTGYGYVGQAGVTGVALTDTNPTGNGVAHNHTIIADGAHSHDGVAANAGLHQHVVNAFSVVPKSYALYYIMKL